MPRKHYKPEEVIKLIRLVEIEIGRGKTTSQACKQLIFPRISGHQVKNDNLNSRRCSNGKETK